MFGFPSLSKLIVLVGIIAAVWYGFKLVARLDKARKAEAELSAQKKRKSGPFGKRRTPPATSDEAEDMVRCPVCEAFVAASGAAGCGRSDCPY